MTDKELSALKALAEAAQANDFANGTSLTSEFLAFTDEASPAAILSLISRVEQAEAASAERANNAIDQTILSMRANVATSTKPADGEIPAVLFDGKSVYDEITAHFGKSHCYSADAVSTVLDAVVRLMRKSGAGGVAGAGDTLPPLPKIGDLGATREARVLHLHYSAEQMREYGQACAQLGRQQTPVGDSVDTPEFHELLGKFRAADIRTTEGVANEIIIFIHSWKDAQLARERHARNEWADAACNGLQWLRNIEDGTTTDLKRARENMEASVAHARQVSDQLGTAPAAQAQGEPVAWEFRFYDQDNEPHKWGEWERVEARWGGTIADRVAEIRAYIARGYKYELRALYAGAAPQADEENVK